MIQILVVEDDPDLSELIAHSLRKAGYSVETLATGSPVMPHVRANAPDAIVST
jgi:DNA-binding response OmpR family regulator